VNISHRQLEELRSNPGRWLGARTANMISPHPFNFRTKFRTWQEAAKRYHACNGNRSLAVEYLESLFWQRFKQNPKNERELTQYTDQLIIYFDSFQRLRHTVSELDRKIKISVGHDINITGLVSRVDLVLSGGYAVYIYEKVNPTWRNELRMPLIQQYFANELACSLNQISVGIYSFSLGHHESIFYSRSAVEAASSEVRGLATLIANHI
jgi:hypothetical protein